MTSRSRIRIVAGCIVVVVLLFPVIVPAQETVAVEDPVAPIADAIGGDPMPAPVTVRFWNYRDEDDVPYCLDLPASTMVVVFSETFTTNPTTSYIELIWTGQFSLRPGVNENLGISFQVWMFQGGGPRIFFPGAGDDIRPLMARRDDSGAGQQMFGGYRGVVEAQPDMVTTIVVRAYSSQKDGVACYQNLSLRYD